MSDTRLGGSASLADAVIAPAPAVSAARASFPGPAHDESGGTSEPLSDRTLCILMLTAGCVFAALGWTFVGQTIESAEDNSAVMVLCGAVMGCLSLGASALFFTLGAIGAREVWRSGRQGGR